MITNLPPTVQRSGGGGDYGGGMETLPGNNPPSIPMLSNATKARNKMIYGINEEDLINVSTLRKSNQNWKGS